MKRVLLAVVVLSAATGAVFAYRAAEADSNCFEYDRMTNAKICGTPEHIEGQMRSRGFELAQSAGGQMVDPWEMCRTRATAQAEMHEWPDRYRDAFIQGCNAYERGPR